MTSVMALRIGQGLPLLAALVLLSGLFAGCTETRLEYDPCSDGDSLQMDGTSPARTIPYDGGPTVWRIKCAADQLPVTGFRMALTLGDGIRMWLGPEPGESVNRTPIPTYQYAFGSGQIRTIEHASDLGDGGADIVFGFYNWGHRWRDNIKQACFNSTTYETGRVWTICDTPFLALWNGTHPDMTSWNPLPAGLYTVEVYLRDASDSHALVVSYSVPSFGGPIDWMACDEPSARLDERRACDGTIRPEVGLADHPWPDHRENKAQARAEG